MRQLTGNNSNIIVSINRFHDKMPYCAHTKSISAYMSEASTIRTASVLFLYAPLQGGEYSPKEMQAPHFYSAFFRQALLLKWLCHVFEQDAQLFSGIVHRSKRENFLGFSPE
jgi:hypothetical protein